MWKRLSVVVAVVVLGGAVASCKDSPPPVPAASDPKGNDLVDGAVVAAVESTGGIRLYKIVHVEDYPDPVGHELHMIAYQEKAATFEEAASMWKKGGMTVALKWMAVAKHLFMTRDHRVLSVEKVTDADKEGYLHAKNSRNR